MRALTDLVEDKKSRLAKGKGSASEDNAVWCTTYQKNHPEKLPEKKLHWGASSYIIGRMWNTTFIFVQLESLLDWTEFRQNTFIWLNII